MRFSFATLGSSLIILATFSILPSVAWADSSCAFSLKNEVNNDVTGVNGYAETSGQPFTVASSCSPTDIGVVVRTVGSPGSHLEYAIYDDSGGHPGAQLGVTTAVSGITGTFGWATSTMSSVITLNTATTYWLVLQRDDALNGSNYWEFYLSSNTPTYGGYWQYYSGGWNAAGSHEMWFQIYGTAGGGGGGSTDNGTTTVSSTDQSEQNLFNAFIIFFLSFFGVVWLFRKI